MIKYFIQALLAITVSCSVLSTAEACLPTGLSEFLSDSGIQMISSETLKKYYLGIERDWPFKKESFVTSEPITRAISDQLIKYAKTKGIDTSEATNYRIFNSLSTRSSANLFSSVFGYSSYYDVDHIASKNEPDGCPYGRCDPYLYRVEVNETKENSGFRILNYSEAAFLSSRDVVDFYPMLLRSHLHVDKDSFTSDYVYDDYLEMYLKPVLLEKETFRGKVEAHIVLECEQ